MTSSGRCGAIRATPTAAGRPVVRAARIAAAVAASTDAHLRAAARAGGGLRAVSIATAAPKAKVIGLGGRSAVRPSVVTFVVHRAVTGHFEAGRVGLLRVSIAGTAPIAAVRLIAVIAPTAAVRSTVASVPSADARSIAAVLAEIAVHAGRSAPLASATIAGEIAAMGHPDSGPTAPRAMVGLAVRAAILGRRRGAARATLAAARRASAVLRRVATIGPRTGATAAGLHSAEPAATKLTPRRARSCAV